MKDDIRIEVSGEIDELNANVGVLAETVCRGDVAHWLAEIQARLFIIGSSLSSAGVEGVWRVGKSLRGDGRLGSDELRRVRPR